MTDSPTPIELSEPTNEELAGRLDIIATELADDIPLAKADMRLAARRLRTPSGLPEGWVAVPWILAEDMVVAGAHALFDAIEAAARDCEPPVTDRWDNNLAKRATAIAVFRAMLTASPPPPTQDQGSSGALSPEAGGARAERFLEFCARQLHPCRRDTLTDAELLGMIENHPTLTDAIDLPARAPQAVSDGELEEPKTVSTKGEGA